MENVNPIRVVITILFFFFIGNIKAQRIVSLHECYLLLEIQNEDVKMANLNILLSEIENKDAKNSFLPTLNLGAGHNYNLGLTFDQIAGQLVTGNNWSNNANANISTRIPIFQNFTLRNRLKQSLLSIESGKLQRQQLLQSLKLQLLTKYIEAIANKSLYEASIKQLNFTKEQLRQEKEKFEIGTNTTIDIAQAETTVANNELNVINNLASYENCLIEIKQLTEINLNDSISVQDIDFDTNQLNLNFDYYNTSQYFYDPLIKNAEVLIKQSTLNLKYARGSFYPSLNLYGGYGTNYSSERKDFLTGEPMPFWNQINQNRGLSFGVSLSAPIFDAFKTRNNISKLKIDIQSKQSELNKLKIERQKIHILAMQEYQKSIKEYEVQLIHLSAQKKNLSAIKERYDIGISNAIEYNKALLDFNLIETNVIKSKYTIIYNFESLNILNENTE